MDGGSVRQLLETFEHLLVCNSFVFFSDLARKTSKVLYALVCVQLLETFEHLLVCKREHMHF